MSGDIVNFRPYSEVEKLHVRLRAAQERIEELMFEAAERDGRAALEQAVHRNQVWFIRLTQKEAMCMSLLCQAAPRVLTKRALMEGLYAADDEPAEKIIDVFICRLRGRLAPLGLDIETEWGLGYRIAPSVARTWERWCTMTAGERPPPDDFFIDPARTRMLTSLGRHWRDFCRDVDLVHGALETGESAQTVMRETGRPLSFVEAVQRGLVSQGSASVEAPAPDIKPEGRTREEIIEAAVSQTVSELGVTLPYTARRAAEIAVDLMTAEVMSIAAEVEE